MVCIERYHGVSLLWLFLIRVTVKCTLSRMETIINNLRMSLSKVDVYIPSKELGHLPFGTQHLYNS